MNTTTNVPDATMLENSTIALRVYSIYEGYVSGETLIPLEVAE